MWVPRQESDPKNKTLCSHYKILSKLTEICWRWLGMTGSYSVQISVARITRGSHVKSRTLEIKHRVHTINFYRNWLKFIGDDSVWLGATLCKAAWLELHVIKNRTLEIKPHVHTIKFYRNWLKFIGDDSVRLAATLCKTAWLELHVGSTSRAGP